MNIAIEEYDKVARSTDQFDQNDVTPILLGLYGEVGGAMAAVKKLKRETKAFTGYRNAVVDELGDTFWYFCALLRRHGLELAEVLTVADSHAKPEIRLLATDDPTYPIASVGQVSTGSKDSTDALLDLGKCASEILALRTGDPIASKPVFVKFAQAYLKVLSSVEVSLLDVLNENSRKISDRFVPPRMSELPDFDQAFPEEEQLPRDFEIEMRERDNGRVYLRWNGVFVGDPLSDNIRIEDGFRYHDVIHFAHVAVLHWSPTVRSLLKLKRKSSDVFDEGEDGGRGTVVEEGLAAWVFSKAKQLDYFEGHDKVSIDILKTISDFVRGYEVEACPSSLWERAILTGYGVFREVRKNRGGIIVGNRERRTLEYRPLEK